jgi:hypothetical protein
VVQTSNAQPQFKTRGQRYNSAVIYRRRTIRRLGLPLPPHESYVSCGLSRDGRDAALLFIREVGWLPFCECCGYAWCDGFRRHVMASVSP